MQMQLLTARTGVLAARTEVLAALRQRPVVERRAGAADGKRNCSSLARVPGPLQDGLHSAWSSSFSARGGWLQHGGAATLRRVSYGAPVILSVKHHCGAVSVKSTASAPQTLVAAQPAPPSWLSAAAPATA